MGFNPMQGKGVKPADLAIFVSSLVVVAALVIWAIRG